MTEREETLTELGQMDEGAYRKWVAKMLGHKPTKGKWPNGSNGGEKR